MTPLSLPSSSCRVVLLLGFLAFGAVPAASAQQAPVFGAAHDGVTIGCGAFGRFTLTYPELDTGGDKPLPVVSATVADGKATLQYAGNAEVDVSVDPGGKIVYTFPHPPAGLKTYKVTMLIDSGFSQGGTWRIGAGDATAFPVEKPAKPFLYQGSDNSLLLTNFEGKSLAFTIPDYSFEQLQDNREWGWKIFAWMFIAPFDKNNPQGTVTVRENVAGAKSVVLADRFGQDAASDFPGKVKSEAELKQDAVTDAAFYAGFHPPARDTSGGLPGSGAALGLTKTGYFHVQKIAGKPGTGVKAGQWFLVDPDGNADFHLGVCGFQPSDDYTYIKDRREVYEWLPPYDSEYKPAFSQDPYWSRDVFSFYIANQIRKYGHYDPEEFQARMISRVTAGGLQRRRGLLRRQPGRPDREVPVGLHSAALARRPGRPHRRAARHFRPVQTRSRAEDGCGIRRRRRRSRQ